MRPGPEHFRLVGTRQKLEVIVDHSAKTADQRWYFIRDRGPRGLCHHDSKVEIGEPVGIAPPQAALNLNRPQAGVALGGRDQSPQNALLPRQVVRQIVQP